MYAVIKTGGKQYRVAQGDTLKVETLAGEVGDTIQFDTVLMIADGDSVNVGTPAIEGAAVSASIVAHGRHKKVEIMKFRRRKHHQKRTGHRQNYTEVEITDIAGSGATAAPKAEKKPAATTPAAAATDTAAGEKPQFLSAPQGEPDDLKKINGVGPVLEGKLNDMGIYHFHQVAAFTEDDITRVDTFLNFKGRITRDDWIGQAKGFMSE